ATRVRASASRRAASAVLSRYCSTPAPPRSAASHAAARSSRGPSVIAYRPRSVRRRDSDIEVRLGFRGRMRTARIARFPPRTFKPMPATATADVPFRSFMCVVCGFIYNEADGWPDDGIAPGTRWEDVPDTWTCPDCGVTKSDFEMIEL